MNPKLKRSLVKILGHLWLILFPALFLLIARRQKDGEWGFMTCARNPFLFLLIDKEDLYEWNWMKDGADEWKLATGAEIWANRVKQKIAEAQQVNRMKKMAEMGRN